MFFLIVYVPRSDLEGLKQALFQAGAGQIGNYTECCWQTSGTGQFTSSKGARPSIGQAGESTELNEIKIEIMCAAEKIDSIIAALLQAHPYETPSFAYWPILTEYTPPVKESP